MPCPEISHVKASCDLHSGCFAMVLTTGFYCDSGPHNVRKVRGAKYIVVSDLYPAASLVCAMIDGKV